jgi:hypothetical protein
MARALHDALHEGLGKDNRIVVEVVAKLSMLSEAHSGRTMHARNWVCLLDHFGGGPQLPQSLREKIKGAETLRSLYATLQEHGIRMVVAEVHEDVREGSRYVFHESIGNDAFYDMIDDVRADYRAKVGDEASA